MTASDILHPDRADQPQLVKGLLGLWAVYLVGIGGFAVVDILLPRIVLEYRTGAIALPVLVLATAAVYWNQY
jgi:hypothetical protein